MKMSNQLILRDFMYIDVERLYSLYSQVFKGVTDRTYESRRNVVATNTFEEDVDISGSKDSRKVANEVENSKTKVLLDHMYNELEAKIEPAILKAEEIGIESWDVKLQQAFMVKVSGQMLFEDYDYITEFANKNNELGRAVASMALMGDEMKSLVAELETMKRTATGEEKKFLEKKLFELTNTNQYAKQNGLHTNPDAVKSIVTVFNYFAKDRFEVSLYPPSFPNALIYRGIIDKRWLRSTPEYIRSLYNGTSPSQWTMVGQVTLIPPVHGVSMPTSESASVQQNEELSEAVSEDVAAPVERPQGLRDLFRPLFNAANTMSGEFWFSKQLVEVFVRPLALYQQVSIPVATSNV